MGRKATTKERLLRAAEQRFLQKGYAATTVEEVCGDAGTTKGAFFHHFRNKEEIALTVVADHGARMFETLKRGADLHPEDPVQRVLDYVDHVIDRSQSGRRPACLVAGLTVEMAEVNDGIQARCDAAFSRWLEWLTGLLRVAIDSRPFPVSADPAALASQFLATFQGSLILARAGRDPAVIRTNLEQYRTYLELLLRPEAPARG